MKETKQIANSRFLYIEQSVSKIDLAGAIGEIDSIIHHSTQVQLAADQIILKFDFGPNSLDFNKSSVLVGREILGHDSEAMALLKFHDFKRTQVRFFDLEMDVGFAQSWESLFLEIRNHQSVVEAWTMLIKDDFSHVEIQF